MVETELIFLCLASFVAGFVDSIVGGGGLIQFPALLLFLPTQPVISILATNKLISFTGTAVSAWRFSRQVSFAGAIILPAVLAAFSGSFLGAHIVTLIGNEQLKPVFMILMFLVFILTIRSKTFGLFKHDPAIPIPLWKPVLIGFFLGFYDGFFGPGTGSFLIIGFVGLLGMTFVQGSAYAKVINLTTNLAAILLFSFKTQFLFHFAVPMMLFNIGGAMCGVKLALLRGNEFVRGLLRIVILATMLKLAYDIFFSK